MSGSGLGLQLEVEVEVIVCYPKLLKKKLPIEVTFILLNWQKMFREIQKVTIKCTNVNII